MVGVAVGDKETETETLGVLLGVDDGDANSVADADTAAVTEEEVALNELTEAVAEDVAVVELTTA